MPPACVLASPLPHHGTTVQTCCNWRVANLGEYACKKEVVAAAREARLPTRESKNREEERLPTYYSLAREENWLAPHASQ